MASTAEARRLTEVHRMAQLRLGAKVTAEMLGLARVLDPLDLDRSSERWLTAVVPLVELRRKASARLAANYLGTFRAMELGVTYRTAPLIVADDVPVKAVATSMLVTGPVSIRAALRRGTPVGVAVRIAAGRSAAAAMRHVLNGGRETVTQSTAADGEALGWARAPSGKACHFCAMLASRGPVFSDDTVHFRAHDGCSCAVEPVYRHDAEWPAGSRRYQQIWRESTRGLSGAEARRAFRDAVAS